MVNILKSWLGLQKEPHEERKTCCLMCGKCCEAFGAHLNASRSDLERWRLLGRHDILNRVIGAGWIWVDPDTKKPEERCPFLEQAGPDTAVCAIYDIRPDMCRDYPTLANGRRCLRGGFLKIWVVVCGGTIWELDTVASAFFIS